MLIPKEKKKKGTQEERIKETTKSKKSTQKITIVSQFLSIIT